MSVPARGWLRADRAAVAIAAVVGVWALAPGWPVWAIVLLALAPDLAFADYAAGPRAGAVVYNLAHSYVGPALLAVLALIAAAPAAALPLALIRAAHVGVDRALGYGLKLSQGFGHTHLGRMRRLLVGNTAGAWGQRPQWG